MKTVIPLLMVLTPAVAAQQDPAAPDPARARYAALTEKVDAAVMAWREEQLAAAKKAAEAAEKARERGQQMAIPAMSMTPPFARFVPEFRAAAGEFAGQDGAVPFLLWIATHGGGQQEAVEASVSTLMRDHFESEALAALPPVLARMARVLGEDEVATMLGRLADDSRHAAVRAQALFARAAPVVEKAKLGSERYEQAKAELLRAAELTTDDELKGRIRGAIAGREQLANGSIAPDIEGVDLEGVAFKLSDYAGKVVMLDFWGDW